MLFTDRATETSELKLPLQHKTILTAMCEHGHLDLSAYESYISGAVSDFDLFDEAIASSLRSVPVLS